MTRKKWVLLIAGAIAGGLLAIGGVAFIGWRIVQQTQSVPDSAPPSAEDKRLLLTAADVARLGGPAVEPGAEKWISIRQGNHGRFVLYHYEPKSEARIRVYSRLALLPDPTGARRMYQIDKITLTLGSEGESYVPAPGLFLGGGDRGAWFVEKDGQRIGNFFLIREGRFLQSAKLTGLTLHDAAEVQNVLGPMLAESRRRTNAAADSR